MPGADVDATDCVHLIESALAAVQTPSPGFVQLPRALGIVQVAATLDTRASFRMLRKEEASIWRGDPADVWVMSQSLPAAEPTIRLLGQVLRMARRRRAHAVEALTRMLGVEVNARLRADGREGPEIALAELRDSEFELKETIRATRAAQRSGNPRVILTTVGHLAARLSRVGLRDEATHGLRLHLAAAERAGIGVVGPYQVLGSLAQFAGDFDEAIRLAARGFRQAHSDRTTRYEVDTAQQLVEICGAAGRPDEVLRWAEQVESLAADLGGRDGALARWTALLDTVPALRDLGRLKDAEQQCVALLDEIQRHQKSSPLGTLVQAELARTYAAQGRLEAARDEFAYAALDQFMNGKPNSALLYEAADAASATGVEWGAVMAGAAFQSNPLDVPRLYLRAATGDGPPIPSQDGLVPYATIYETLTAVASADDVLKAAEGLVRQLIAEGRHDEAEDLADKEVARHPLTPAEVVSPLAIRAHTMLARTLAERPSGLPRAREVVIATTDRLAQAVRTSVADERRSELVAQWHPVFSLALDLHVGGSRQDVLTAFKIHESAKGRTLLAEMAGAEMPAPAHVSASLLRSEQALLRQKRRIIRTETRDRTSLNARLTHLQAELDWCWSQMEPAAPDYTRTRRAETIDAEHVEALLAPYPSVCVWSFFVDERTTTCFVLHGGNRAHAVEVVTLPISRLAIADALRQLRLAFNGDWSGLFPVAPIDADHPESADGRLAAARSIGDALSTIPVSNDAEHLIVAAHGPLHGFPFAAFINGTPTLPRTTTAVTHVPSLSVLALALSRSRGNERPQRFAAFAVTSADDEDRESFERVLDEVAFAAATERASGPAASKSAVLRALETVDVLHLTCHGLFDEADPLGSGLLLGNGTDRPPRAPRTTDERDSFVLTARELLDTESTCRLVALQACSSGVQQERNLGDEFEGLIRALLYSGVSTVIVSLWNVDRDSSNAAFRVFYREWLDTGVPVGVAWQRAQVALRDGGEPAWRHPYHWAPFACIGDFR